MTHWASSFVLSQTQIGSKLALESKFQVVHALISSESRSIGSMAKVLTGCDSSWSVWFLQALTSSAEIESVQHATSDSIEHLVVSFHLAHVHWFLVLPSVSFVLLLQPLNLFEQVVILPLNCLLLRNGIFLGREQEALLLIPLSPVSFVSKNHFCLL